MKPLVLSIQDSNILKGFAILLLLMHHLFFSTDANYHDYILPNGLHLINAISVGFGKFCVAIFVFLSGYGLTKATNKIEKIWEWGYFYRKRYIKLMSSYWLIFLIFVPIEILAKDKTFAQYYGDSYVWKAIFDFLGLSHIIGYTSYNPSWWFYGCIIILYAFFPFVYSIRNRYIVLIGITLLSAYLLYGMPVIGACWPYQLTFVLGVIMATYNTIPTKTRYSNTLLFCAFVIVAICRMRDSWIPIWQDVLLCYLLSSIYSNIRIGRSIALSLSFLGKHSFNIFLFHAFYLRLIPNIIYYTHNPILSYLTFLFICILTSISIEQIKKVLFFHPYRNN